LTLQSMEQVAQAFAGYPGRKTLVWASAGFPFALNEETMALKEGLAPVDTPANMQPLYEKTWAALNRAQISVYPVDVHGLGDLARAGDSAREEAATRPVYARAVAACRNQRDL